jgi:hypothetical protein
VAESAQRDGFVARRLWRFGSLGSSRPSCAEDQGRGRAQPADLRFYQQSGAASLCQRSSARAAGLSAAAREVDLSQISTNQKLGQQLAEAIEAERQLLFASEPCRGARERKETGFFQLLWRRHGHLVLLGGAALALLFFTPLMMRRIGPSAWGRILTFTLPVLAMLAFWTTAVVKTNRAREALVAAQRLCSPQHHPRARDSKGLRKQVDLLGQLRRYVSSARVIRR